MENRVLYLLIIGLTIVISLLCGVIGFYVGVDAGKDIDELEYNYWNSRFYEQALSDFWLMQLYMFPFNETDIVTLEYENEKQTVMCINHTVPNPDHVYIDKFVYDYRLHFDHELTIEEVKP